jgi:uncharacterized protein YdhG (YjbR/CyaY superfamily)
MAATTTKRTSTDGTSFTDAEKEAMKERSRELKAARSAKGKVDGEQDLRAKIAEMPQPDRDMAERIHAIVRSAAPALEPRTWYGMPAYARDGKIVCFFQPASKFKARYATFGFNEDAKLDDGTMWPTSWALTQLDPVAEAAIAELVRKAVG